ncbi:MAG: hypothetical protein JKY45_03180 [Emcibacter sp.]|nr:hypothetical protein [Emcibacter sp.]
MIYAEKVAEHRRLTILRMLNDQDDASLNTSVLLDGLAEVGFGVHKSVLAEDVKLMKNLEVVTVQELSGGICVVAITPHGIKVVRGLIRADGIKYPGRQEV